MCVMLCVTFLVDDTLESVLGGSDDEAEEDAVISQVLDEIGIDVTSKVSTDIGSRLDTETKGSVRCVNPRALGYSNPRTAKVVLRVQAERVTDPIGRGIYQIYAVYSRTPDN